MVNGESYFVNRESHYRR